MVFEPTVRAVHLAVVLVLRIQRLFRFDPGFLQRLLLGVFVDRIFRRRRRPDRLAHEVPIARHVPMPTSRSFPSGHSAAAFAFAGGAGAVVPAASLPLHAFFGVELMGTRTVLGAAYYRSLGLPWHTDLLGDQRLGGGIAWAAGELPLVIVMIALLVQWARSDERTARRLDRAAERNDDAELTAYNAMLAELARRETPEPR